MTQRATEKRIAIVIPVRNGRSTVSNAIDSALEQQLPAGWKLDIILADDGSTDALQDYIEQKYPTQVHMVRLPDHQGRSAARNHGVRAAGTSKLIAFLDADCVYSTRSDLAKHIRTILAGTDISCGPISVRGEGFWARYQRDVSESRHRASLGRNPTAMTTTANMVVRRSCFESIGGFDEAYSYYGFEDRDFVLRALDNQARMSVCTDAVVIHQDRLTLWEVCRKAKTAGKYNSLLFLQRHPGAYNQMSYAKVDSRLHGSFIRMVDRISTPVWPLLVFILGPLLKWELLPFTVRRLFVKFVTGLAYLDGTLASSTFRPPPHTK